MEIVIVINGPTIGAGLLNVRVMPFIAKYKMIPEIIVYQLFKANSTITPLHHYTITPLHHYTITPLQFFRINPIDRTVPTFRYALFNVQ